MLKDYHLKPFEGGKQLTDLTVECFKRLKPYFGECITIIRNETP